MLHFVIFIDAHPISSSRSFAVFFFTFSVNWGHQVDRESVASPLPRQVSFWGGGGDSATEVSNWTLQYDIC